MDSGNGEALVGEVSAIVYTNDATGFGVVELTGAGKAGGARASGPLAALQPGQPVKLVGRWTEHPRYGPTFSAVYYEQAPPRSSKGLAAFLSSDRFPGVGKTLAKRLVAKFGLDLADIVETDPQRLAEVSGVSHALAERIAASWQTAGVLARLVTELGAAGISAAAAQAVYREFGDQTPELLVQDPYRLLSVRGVAWAHVEALARKAKIEPSDPRRLAAGAGAAHAELSHAGGHTAVEQGVLLDGARRLLGVASGDAAEALRLAARRGALVRDTVGDEGLLDASTRGVADAQDGPPPHGWYHPADLAAERGLVSALARLLGATSRVAAAAGDHDPDPELTPEQAGAVRAALSHAVSVLTGGPGTGKTRTVLEIVRACESRDLRVALCAPTGRAAKRLEEVTGRGATTIHRLLEARGAPGSGFAFGYDDTRRLPHDVIVADEWSMADTRLAWALTQAVSSGAHLVCVGDADQLPSVGPGAVLRDLLAPELSTGAQPVVAATRLTKVHRQAAASRIVTLAHEVNAGTVAPPQGRDGDVFAVPEQSRQIAQRVAEIVAVRAPAYFGCAPSDVQVLAPMYKGPAGVDALNAGCKERLNPAAGRRAVAGFHEGDRVVATRNDAELDVANGDIGEVIATDPGAGTVEVAFPQGSVTFDGERAADLAPAWCLTVHKSQGGEWPVVVFVCDPGHRRMLWRELAYTAITRAAMGLLLVGHPGLISDAAQRTGSGLRHRRTLLTQRLVLAVASERDGDAA